jgi:hypothetical protein
MPQAQNNAKNQTINNITINNFAANQNSLFFPALDNLVAQKPSASQASELEAVTRQAGGVRPLHAKEPKLGFLHDDEAEEKDLEKKQLQQQFEFPEGGWECHKCQNYNFKGRKACFRCKKSKDEQDTEGKPEHMLSGGKIKKSKEEATSQQKVEKRYLPPGCKHERIGDWTCQRCFNHNFSFRESCNMCYLSHGESNRILYQVQQNRYQVS